MGFLNENAANERIATRLEILGLPSVLRQLNGFQRVGVDE
jgi:hypothetical protein